MMTGIVIESRDGVSLSDSDDGSESKNVESSLDFLLGDDVSSTDWDMDAESPPEYHGDPADA
jgi:hypothetical protein